jgi:hypothetical protein
VIVVIQVKKELFFAPCKTRSTKFKSSWLKTLSLNKVEVFDIMLENSIENPQ